VLFLFFFDWGDLHLHFSLPFSFSCLWFLCFLSFSRPEGPETWKGKKGKVSL